MSGTAGAHLLRALRERGVNIVRRTTRSRVGAVIAFGPVPVPEARRMRPRLARRGQLFVVASAAEVPEALVMLSDAGLEPKRLWMEHVDVRSGASRVVIIAVPGKPGGLVVEPTFSCRTGAVC